MNSNTIVQKLDNMEEFYDFERRLTLEGGIVESVSVNQSFEIVVHYRFKNK